jgi:hypothetical protein
MSFTGTVKDGVVVLPREAKLPEGAKVEVQPISEDPFVKTMLKLARPRPEWPRDFALNQGHYLYGEPKRD